MLRVGLTGGLGSGKSTVARMLAAHGAFVLAADEIARELMQPGTAVYTAIVERFGRSVVSAEGRLDRGALARIAFAEDRVEELNAIVHPATIARQAQRIEEIAARKPHAIVVIESALIFETKYGGPNGWRERFDRMILVRASEKLKITRFIQRSSLGRDLSDDERAELAEEARRRLSKQIDDESKAPQCDYVIVNDGSLDELSKQVDALWKILSVESAKMEPEDL